MSWGTRGVPIRGLSSHLLVCVRVQLQKFSVFFFFVRLPIRGQQRGERWGHSRIHLLFIFKRLSFGCCCCCCCCHWRLICGRCLFMCFVYLCRAHDYCRRARTAACLFKIHFCKLADILLKLQDPKHWKKCVKNRQTPMRWKASTFVLHSKSECFQQNVST